MSSIFKLILTDECNICPNNRKYLLENCALLWNMETFKDFLVYKNKNKYISINQPHISNSNKIYEIDMISNRIVQLKNLNKNQLVNDNNFDDFSKYIDYNIIYSIKTSIIELPIYYLFIDESKVINPILNYYKSIPNIFKDIFRIDKTTNSFIGMSMMINIFNLSLFTYKYFQLIEVFIEYFKYKDYIMYTVNVDNSKIKEKINTKLNLLFTDIKDFVVSLYNFNDFRVFHNNIYEKKRDEYTEQEIQKNEFNCIKEEVKEEELKEQELKEQELKEQELKEVGSNKTTVDLTLKKLKKYSNKLPKSRSYDMIIDILTVELISIGNIIYEISRNLEIPELKYLFLFSILRFRLKNPFVTGTWGFTINGYLEQLGTTIKIKDKYNNNLKNIFIKIKLPTIYEYHRIIYKGQNFGNCVENTILQFFKLLLWNSDEDDYDISKIEEIVRKPYVKKMEYFFQNIKTTEKQKSVEWVDFLTDTLYKDNLEPKIDYIFKQNNVNYNGKNEQIELRSKLFNLYNAVIKILKIPLDNEYDIFENKEQMTNKDLEKVKDTINKFFLKNNDLFIQYIKDIISGDGTVKVKLNCKDKDFNIIFSGGHTYFLEAESIGDDGESYIIANNFPNINELIKNLKTETKPEFFNVITQYIIMKIFFNSNSNNSANNNYHLFKYFEKVSPKSIEEVWDTTFDSDLFRNNLFQVYKLIKHTINIMPDIYNNANVFLSLLLNLYYQVVITYGNDRNDLIEDFGKNDKITISESAKKFLVHLKDKNLFKDIINMITIPYRKDFWNTLINGDKLLDLFLNISEEGKFPKLIEDVSVENINFWKTIFFNEHIKNIIEKDIYNEDLSSLIVNKIKNIKDTGFWLWFLEGYSKDYLFMFTKNRRNLEIFLTFTNDKNVWSFIYQLYKDLRDLREAIKKYDLSELFQKGVKNIE